MTEAQADQVIALLSQILQVIQSYDWTELIRSVVLLLAFCLCFIVSIFLVRVFR